MTASFPNVTAPVVRYRHPMQWLDAEQSPTFRPSGPHYPVGVHEAAIEREQHGHGMSGDLVSRIHWLIHDRHAALFRGVEIDIVQPYAAARDRAHTRSKRL